ncbi:hypothetical protein [Selenomonas ruminantium]|uniref:hypothetical protein n=1 Tax=Selenomonas ruminantium TaxID=971 RepID=UPI00047B5EC8|nr:hypothetical protein [Selenomonas ruminantium]
MIPTLYQACIEIKRDRYIAEALGKYKRRLENDINRIYVKEAANLRSKEAMPESERLKQKMKEGDKRIYFQ